MPNDANKSMINKKHASTKSTKNYTTWSNYQNRDPKNRNTNLRCTSKLMSQNFICRLWVLFS